MSNYEILTIKNDDCDIDVVRFKDFGIDFKKVNFDDFIRFNPNVMEGWLEATKDFVCAHSLVPCPYDWDSDNLLLKKLRYSPYEARIFRTSKSWDFQLDEKIYLFKEDAIIQSSRNLNHAFNTDYGVIIRPDLLSRSLEGLVEVQEKLDELLKNDAEKNSVAGDNTTPSPKSEISDFVKLNILMGKLYEKSSNKLRKHLKKAYLEISLIDTIKARFNKNDEEAEKILYALNRVYWLVENKKYSFEKAKIKVSEDLGIAIEDLSSLSASKSSFKKHMRKI